MEERQELLEHWKWIVRAVFQAEYNLGQRGERINKEAEDTEVTMEILIICAMVLNITSILLLLNDDDDDEILSKTIDNEEDDKLQQNQREVTPPF